MCNRLAVMRWRAGAGLLALISGCAGPQLEVRAHRVTQGTASVDCALATRGPDSARLVLEVRTPCYTGKALVRAFNGDTQLAPAEECHYLKTAKLNVCQSGWFVAPTRGTVLTASVWGTCDSGQPIQGEDTCRMP